jgi:hypothetical protein
MSDNIISGESYLCDYHRDTLQHVVCAVCPVCARKERSQLTLNAIENYDRAEKAEARVKELEEGIAAALRIKQLWGPPDDVENLLYSGPDDHVAYEYRALHSMLTKFEELVK